MFTKETYHWFFYVTLSLCFFIQTTTNNIQTIVESRVEKRFKGVFVPPGGKRLLWFLDDLNMPAHDLFGSQPPLELLRLWIDYGFWYDCQNQTLKFVKVRTGSLKRRNIKVCFYLTVFDYV